MIHRNSRPDDLAYGKYNGLGGKVEPTEDIAQSMRRELLEESNLTVDEMKLRGTISWPGFGKQGEDWLAYIFLVTRWSGELLTANHEGTLEWIPKSRVLAFDLNLWGGDHYFLPLVFDDDPRPFHGVMPYSNGHAVSWDFTRL